MGAKEKMSSIGQPVPELPVTDVERAQQHYSDALGFEIGWLYPGKEIGAVSRGNVAIFFRKRTPPFEPSVHWVFGEDIDASYQELKSLGANIVDPLEKSLGDYGSSPQRILTETSSISTMTNQAPHNKRLGRRDIEIRPISLKTSQDRMLSVIRISQQLLIQKSIRHSYGFHFPIHP